MYKLCMHMCEHYIKLDARNFKYEQWFWHNRAVSQVCTRDPGCFCRCAYINFADYVKHFRCVYVHVGAQCTLCRHWVLEHVLTNCAFVRGVVDCTSICSVTVYQWCILCTSVDCPFLQYVFNSGFLLKALSASLMLFSCALSDILHTFPYMLYLSMLEI